MFLLRINSKGMVGNKFWYSRDWNHGAGTKNKMPNCTTGCIGFGYEAVCGCGGTVTEPYQMFKAPHHTPGAFPVAKDWYKCWILDKGIEPKVGGFAVWGASKSNPDGHVAFVLETKDVGSQGAWMRVCQSNYHGTYFEVKEYTVKLGVITPGVGCPYVGCCYNPIKDMRVERNINLLQVEVLTDSLNCRMTPGGVAYSGRRVPKGIYTIFDRMESGDYVWAELDNDCWIALNDKDGWTRTYEVETLEKRYATLQNAYEVLSQKYTDLVLRYEKETGKKV